MESQKVQEVTIHQLGFSEKLNPIETKFHRSNINAQQYEEVPYLSTVAIKDLQHDMVTLDQLPKFQDILQDMPLQFHPLITGSAQDQAYFLLQYRQKYQWKFINTLQKCLKGMQCTVKGDFTNDLN